MHFKILSKVRGPVRCYSQSWLRVTAKVCGIVEGHGKSWWHDLGSKQKFVAWFRVTAKVHGIIRVTEVFCQKKFVAWLMGVAKKKLILSNECFPLLHNDLTV